MPPFNLHFPENGWEKITQNGFAWWAGELERALIIPSISLPRSIIFMAFQADSKSQLLGMAIATGGVLMGDSRAARYPTSPFYTRIYSLMDKTKILAF
jgi:hypothetical protein